MEAPTEYVPSHSTVYTTSPLQAGQLFIYLLVTTVTAYNYATGKIETPGSMIAAR